MWSRWTSDWPASMWVTCRTLKGCPITEAVERLKKSLNWRGPALATLGAMLDDDTSATLAEDARPRAGSLATPCRAVPTMSACGFMSTLGEPAFGGADGPLAAAMEACTDGGDAAPHPGGPRSTGATVDGAAATDVGAGVPGITGGCQVGPPLLMVGLVRVVGSVGIAAGVGVGRLPGPLVAPWSAAESAMLRPAT